jgi:hypothetical protein
MIVTGLSREVFGGLPGYDPEHLVGAVDIHQGNGPVMGASILVLLRAFANGGSSLTGVEAVSNTVNVFRKPEGTNARRVLTVMAFILGFLVASVSYMHTSPTPRRTRPATRRCYRRSPAPYSAAARWGTSGTP